MSMQKTISFLRALKSNNNKDWFEKNKANYLVSKEEFELLVDKLIVGISKFDKKINPDLKAKDCTFRIYKDVRFSKDKTPYKTNMGASMNPGGRKSPVAGYYFHLEPGGSFLAGGMYMPEPDMLNAIRQEIDYNPDSLLKIMKAASFKKYFKDLDEIDKLKTAPKGYAKDHVHLDLLQHKHFIVSHPISDKQLLDKNLDSWVLSGFKAMQPFLDFLREATAK